MDASTPPSLKHVRTSMCTEKKEVEYEIKLATIDDINRMISFIKRCFADEPLTSTENGVAASCSQFEQWCVKSISEGVSLTAVNSTGDLLGVSINGILTREDSTVVDNEYDWSCSHPPCLKIIHFLGLAGKESDVFGRFPEIDTVLEIRLQAVDPTFRRQGISTELRRGVVALAAEKGIPLVKTDCTSAFSARAVANLGFTCVSSLRYSDHLGSDGLPVFAPAPPHDRLRTYVYHIHPTIDPLMNYTV